MYLEKSHRLLRKIQALLENLRDQGTMSALERDLLLSYLRDIYAEIQDSAGNNPVITRSNGPQVHQHAISPHSKESGTASVTIQEQPVEQTDRQGENVMNQMKEPLPKSEPEPVPSKLDFDREAAQSAIADKVMEKPTAVQEDPVAEPAQTPMTATPVVQTETGRKVPVPTLISLFEIRADAELSEKLQSQPLERIESGLGINERILTVNELFGGDHELFRQTVAHLNALEDFGSARDYLLDNIAVRFHWADDNRKAKAQQFIRLVSRKYIRLK